MRDARYRRVCRWRPGPHRAAGGRGARRAALRVAPVVLRLVDSSLAALRGVESVLEVEVRGPVARCGFRVPAPADAPRPGAVYADLARLVAGERPILWSAPCVSSADERLADGRRGRRARPGRSASSCPSWPMPACRPDVPAGIRHRGRTSRCPDRASPGRASSTRPRPRELDVLFLATDAARFRARSWRDRLERCPLIVDNSSAFRLDPAVPLVVPEANAADAATGYAGNLVANPNCTTAAAVVALAPIRDLAGLEAVDLASYQAVSGAGRAGVDAFEAERGDGRPRSAPPASPVPRPHRRQRRAPDRRPGRGRLDRRGAQGQRRAAQDPWPARASTWPRPRSASRSTPATRWRSTCGPSATRPRSATRGRAAPRTGARVPPR